MTIDVKKLKMMSSIGMRASFGLSCLELVKDNSDLLVVTSDVSTSAGLDRFRKQYPENFVDVGISEQNLIGVATGLAAENFKVITTTFAPFQTLRCCEQIKVNLGYMESKVLLVGLASGLVLGNLGFTHCSIEEIGALRSIPNLKIIVPADSFELKKVLEYFLKSGDQSVYLRLTGGSNIQQIYNGDYNYAVGKAIILKEGSDVCFFSCGAILKNVIKAAELLEKEHNISSKIINMHTIKPIDKEEIIKNKNFKLHICVEEHNVIGGLASAISEVKCQEGIFVKQINLGVNDAYTKSGSYEYMLDHYNLSTDKIVKNVIKGIN
jgi:transketolase